MVQGLTDREIQTAHFIADQAIELARYKVAVREARDLLADAAQANAAGDHHVVAEFIDRAYLKLGATCAKAGVDSQTPEQG